MKTTRYSHKNLESDLPELNAKLAKLGHQYQFVAGARNGYSAIDLATAEQAKTYCCQRMLIGGTPRECLSECHQYIAALV